MHLTILLILILLFTIAWMVLAIVRDNAINRHAEIQQALSLYWSRQSMQRSEARHQETLRRLTGREDPVASVPETVELPEWVKPYVEVQEDEGFSYSSYKLGFGGYLSSVPNGWFHGAFGVMILVLSLLGFAEAGGMWDGA